MSHRVTFTLLRHAEKTPGPGDLGLSAEGRRQAASLAQTILPWSPQLIVSSTLTRARDTAEAIASAVGTTVNLRDDLIEREVAPPQGGGASAFRAEWARIDADRDYRPYAGESSRMAAVRMARALRQVVAGSHLTRVVAVTHGGIIRDFVVDIAEALGIEQYMERSFRAEMVPLASGTIVTWDGAGFALTEVAQTGDDLRFELSEDDNRHPTD